MNARVERAISTSFHGLTPLYRLFAWVILKWKSHRARMIEAETLAYMRSLDCRILEDIGVEISQADHPLATLAKSNPYFIAASTLGASPSSALKQRRQP